MPTFNVVFEGVTPSPAREVVAEALRKADPAVLVMPAAGRFGAIAAAVKAGIPADRVYASDISLFSSVIGYLADPDRALADLELSFHGRGQGFVEDSPTDEYDLSAAVLLAVKYEQLVPNNQHAMNLRKELWTRRLAYRERVADELRALVKVVHGLHYEVLDLRLAIEPWRDSPDAAFFIDPPGYSAHKYVMMLASDSVSWARRTPDQPWDKAALAQLYRDYLEVPMLGLAYSINAEFLPDGWCRLLAVSRKAKDVRTDYVVANRDLSIVRSLTQHTQTAGGQARRFEVYADQEITATSTLEFVELDRPTVMYYRDLFVHRLGTTQSEWYLGMLVDGRLVTVMGLNRQRFMHYKSGYVKETFGISATSQRYKRLGTLFMLALTTTAFRDWMRLHGRYGIREMAGVETTSLTKHEVSKTDRGMMTLVSKERLPNGTWKLQYRADLRDETFQQVLERWLATSAIHSRSGAAKESGAGPAPVGRRQRRKRREQEAVADG